MLDQADLDFGIYRIMNQKRDQIESYLNNDLRKQVTEAIRENTSNDAEELKKELASLVSTLTAAGMNPDDAPKVKELKERIAQCGNSENLENEVYSLCPYSSAAIMTVATSFPSAVTRRMCMQYRMRVRK